MINFHSLEVMGRVNPANRQRNMQTDKQTDEHTSTKIITPPLHQNQLYYSYIYSSGCLPVCILNYLLIDTHTLTSYGDTVSEIDYV